MSNAYYGAPGRRHYPVKVEGYKRSINFGAFSLHPLEREQIDAFLPILRNVVKQAEDRAYEAGRRDARLDFRRALGLKADD